MDGVAGVDGEDGFVEGGVGAVEDGGGELVALRCGGGASGCEGGGDLVGLPWGFGEGLDDGGGDGSVGDGAGDVGGEALVVFGEEVDGVAS